MREATNSTTVEAVECDTCRGTGLEWGETCISCGGSSVVCETCGGSFDDDKCFGCEGTMR